MKIYKALVKDKVTGGVKMELLTDIFYKITWRLNQILHKVINKPVKGYKRTLTIKEIIKG